MQVYPIHTVYQLFMVVLRKEKNNNPQSKRHQIILNH